MSSPLDTPASPNSERTSTKQSSGRERATTKSLSTSLTQPDSSGRRPLSTKSPSTSLTQPDSSGRRPLSTKSPSTSLTQPDSSGRRPLSTKSPSTSLTQPDSSGRRPLSTKSPPTSLTQPDSSGRRPLSTKSPSPSLTQPDSSGRRPLSTKSPSTSLTQPDSSGRRPLSTKSPSTSLTQPDTSGPRPLSTKSPSTSLTQPDSSGPRRLSTKSPSTSLTQPDSSGRERATTAIPGGRRFSIAAQMASLARPSSGGREGISVVSPEASLASPSRERAAILSPPLATPLLDSSPQAQSLFGLVRNPPQLSIVQKTQVDAQCRLLTLLPKVSQTQCPGSAYPCWSDSNPLPKSDPCRSQSQSQSLKRRPRSRSEAEKTRTKSKTKSSLAETTVDNLATFKQDPDMRRRAMTHVTCSLGHMKQQMRLLEELEGRMPVDFDKSGRHGSDVTYVDIGDSVSKVHNYGYDTTLDFNLFKRKKEIFISPEAVEILKSNPNERTLIQLEKARRELQRAAVFSEYPIEIQEAFTRRLVYLSIGPKRTIMRRGHDSKYFYIVVCGHAYAREPDVDAVTGKTMMTAAKFLKTGDTFGAADLIKRRPHHATVISRSNMQLLVIEGDDYLQQFWYPTLRAGLRPHLVYLSKKNFMENFPMELLQEYKNLSACTLHHFRRNTIIVKDSRENKRLFVVKDGYCQVFRKLDCGDDKVEFKESEILKEDNTTPRSRQNLGLDDQYVERKSAWVTYKDILSPMGNPVRLPVTKWKQLQQGQADEPLPLKEAKGLRQFLPLMLLKEGDIFGLDQTSLCPYRRDSRAVILVSLGAEVIALQKKLYCKHTRPETYVMAERTFIYDDKLISSRLKSRVNRDVHMEAVLDHYFTKASLVRRSTMPEV